MPRDAYIWMLHGDAGEDNFVPFGNPADAGENWIESGPHLMMMPKDVASIADYSTDFNTGAPYLMFKDNQYAHVMIPTPGYYDYTSGRVPTPATAEGMSQAV